MCLWFAVRTALIMISNYHGHCARSSDVPNNVPNDMPCASPASPIAGQGVRPHPRDRKQRIRPSLEQGDDHLRGLTHSLNPHIAAIMRVTDSWRREVDVCAIEWSSPCVYGQVDSRHRTQALQVQSQPFERLPISDLSHPAPKFENEI